ncbi:sensor histidine kinase [Campylobacter blaseri]|nr:HAMP domain-containing sensor histidine kinase [Campylobacter blaseri]
MLIIIFSTMLYHYIKVNIFENVVQILNQHAIKISQIYEIDKEISSFYSQDLGHSIVTTNIIENKYDLKKPKYLKTELENRTFLELQYPVKSDLIVLKTDTTFYDNIVSQILVDIIIINVTMSLLIIFYAMFLSRTILLPIKILSRRLSKLDETVLTHIDETSIPIEFKPLSKGINRLIDRIHTFMEYQKELFIGIAHELKTPLAVMKTKNEVTLLKDREKEKYIEALQNNNNSINNMNKMISSILEIGRQEDAQFEPAVKKDIIAYLREICTNFQILAKAKGQNIKTDLKPVELYMNIQPQLFLHILQNFLQNAIKFSKEGSNIYVKSEARNKILKIYVIDEGIGINEDADLFAPFKRYGNEGGAGLGLFLAKGAAQAMNAKISIKNRTDGKSGAVAKIELPIDLRNLDKN